jgi:predicted  nucleic acid-binding Zn-ribbon protein
MSHECQRCGENKPAGEMVVRGGKPSRTCVECFRKAMGKPRAGKATASTRAKRSKRQAREVETQVPEPVTIAGLSLEILPGFGFRAGIENEHLQLEQDAGQGEDARTDSITLSKTEAKVFIVQFAEWAGVELAA